MSKYFLIKAEGEHMERGSIFKLEGNLITDMDIKTNHTHCQVIMSLDHEEISESNAEFLLKKNRNERIKFHIDGLFNKIEGLRSGDKCIIITRKEIFQNMQKKLMFVRRIGNTDNIVVKLKNGKEMSISVSDIECVENVDYYICETKYANMEVGTIMVDEGEGMKTFPDGKYSKIDRDKVERISRAEAVFMRECPRENRLEMHKDKLWESISKLAVGDTCSLRTEMDGRAFTIIGKEKREDSVKYSLESRDKTRKKMSDVDAWDIRPVMVKTETGCTMMAVGGVKHETSENVQKGDDNDAGRRPPPKVTKMKWTKEKFLKNNFDLRRIDQDQSGDVVGQLVYFGNNARIYGRVRFRVTLINEALVGIRVNKDSLEKNNNILKDALFRDDEDMEGGVIILARSRATVFKEELRCRGDSVIINDNSIRVREGYTSSEIKKNDIVRYTNEEETCHGRVVISELLNDIPCVGVVNSINLSGDKEVRYIREEEVRKIRVDLSTTKYLEDTIIDPLSIVTFVESNNEDLRVNDEVEFKLRCSLSRYQGKVMMVAEVNDGVPSIVLALTAHPGQVDVSRYSINEITSFKKVISRSRGVVVVIPANAVHAISQKVLFCGKNKVSVLDPPKVRNVNLAHSEDKMIIFKSGGETVVARCKWIGRVNNEVHLGCEMKSESLYGTDGTFGSGRLFHCADRRGLLIPLSSVTECCVNESHKNLRSRFDGRVIGSSVCCARMVGQEGDKSGLRVDARVMRMSGSGKGGIFGTCRWRGLVNEVEVIGVELLQGKYGNGDERLDELALFDCASSKRGLFPARGFVRDLAGLCYCTQNDVFVVDPSYITSVDKGSTLQKTIMYKIDRKPLIMHIRWRGVVNGTLCVGSELNGVSEYGADGVFMGERLFECAPDRGVLIPVDKLVGSCEYGDHKDADKNKHGAINPTSVCCAQSICSINRWPRMVIGSKVVYKTGYIWESKVGKCKWMGLVNGQESVGVEMREEIDDVRFLFVDLFKCKDGRRVLFDPEYLEHDIDGERLHFLENKIVDVSKTWRVKEIGADGMGDMKVGDCMSMNGGPLIGAMIGELKWMGTIEGEECVGIDLEEEFEHGMDGVIKSRHRFACPPRHGLVTTRDNVEPVRDVRPSLTSSGVIDADKYLKCEEKWDEEYLRENNIHKDGAVYIIIDINKIRRKMKGTLRWCGTMNGEGVAVVELDQDCDNGTDGRFWRQHLIHCKDKRAVAVPLHSVSEYVTYKSVSIPERSAIFSEVDINSEILYYVSKGEALTFFHGTVRWTGADAHGQYLYGLELVDECTAGSDGLFDGQRLFQCKNGHGVLTPIVHVVPNMRSVASEGQRSLRERTACFESTVIDPRSVVTVEIIYSEECALGVDVQFALPESSNRYSGTWQWTGLVNKAIACTVLLENLAPNDPLRGYLCSSKLKERMKLAVTGDMVIVLWDRLKKAESIMQKAYLRRIFRVINNTDLVADILMEIVNHEDTGLLRKFLVEWKHPIDLDRHPELLPKLISKDDYDLISVLLDKLVTHEKDDVHLVQIAKYFFVKGDNKSFTDASKKCKDVNILSDTGETFLTSLIRENDDEDLINTAIGSGLFDVNKANSSSETPLVLACDRLMVSSARLLVDSGACVGYKNNLALRTVMQKKKNISDMEMSGKILDITDSLTQDIRMDSNVCSICMDKAVDTALNCGHTFCAPCSKEFVVCPKCNQRITDRRKIYLT